MPNCSQCQSSFEILPEDRRFYEKMAPTIGGKTFPLLDPIDCPYCRQMNRMVYRNFRSLYHRNCDLTGKSIIAMYDKDAPFPVYDYDTWHSDKWNPMKYGRDYDSSHPFLEQYKAFSDTVPRYNIHNNQCENCRYSNFSFASKDCYLVFGCVMNERCYFGHIVWESEQCFDCLYAYRCKYCYECVDCVDCYELFFSQECVACTSSTFLYDCRNCKNCFGCVGLNNKQYHIFNQPYSKDEYEKRIAELQFLSPQIQTVVQQRMQDLKLKHVHPHFVGSYNENVSGNHVYYSKNVHYSFDAKQCEDAKYLYTASNTKDCHDISFNGGISLELAYNSLTLFSCQNIIVNHATSNCFNAYYSEFCFDCEHIFGCNGLKYKKYCILNKQYSQEEYERLILEIIESMVKDDTWSRFFPISHSPFAYNESVAQEYQPLTQEQCLEKGRRWKEDLSVKSYKGPLYSIPERIQDVQDDILEAILICEVTGKPYKLIPQELQFYRDHHLPIPRVHSDERHLRRMRMRNPRKLWNRVCAKCEKPIQTTYSSDRLETVTCEACYLKTVY